LKAQPRKVRVRAEKHKNASPSAPVRLFMRGQYEAPVRTRPCEDFYARPYSSWERDSNENSNRILRRFVPKDTDVGALTATELQRIEDWVDNYPRKILRDKSANEFAACANW
jgi:IS30 family transposase